MFYTVYKITNKINGKIYIGKHQTKDANDSYMGSGKYIKRSIKKYGIENFTKEILFVFDNEEDMNSKEAELVTEEFCIRNDTYNLCSGGRGGFSYMERTGTIFRITSENSKYYGEKAKEKLKILFQDEDYIKKHRENSLKGNKISIENNPNGTFHNKTHTDKTKSLMSASAKGKHDGEKNSQFGKFWCTNGVDNIKLKSDDEIPEGFRKGRVLNKKVLKVCYDD